MWNREIVEAIDGCKVLILAIQRSTESENVVKRPALASERRKKILPVCLDASVSQSRWVPVGRHPASGVRRGEEEQGLLAMIRSLGKLGVTSASRRRRGGQGARLRRTAQAITPVQSRPSARARCG